MNGLAYSYLRFSTPDQAMGDSRRRQLALAENYAQQHGLLLDRGLNFRDLGVSAFRGRNAKQGGLRAFLDAIEHGLVPANSHLLVESLDRLSREQILAAQALFLQIITAGVTIVTLLDQRSYSMASLNANPTDLIISLVYMMRANEESATKSARLRAAWIARRDKPGNRHHGMRCPGWLASKPDRNGYDVIPEKAAVVQRIYREALAGTGLQTITHRLNAEGVPLFGHGNQRGKIWQRALVRHLLRTPLVIGTYTPCRSEIVDGKLRYVPIEPKEGYYPAIISVADFEAMRSRRLAWSTHYGCTNPKRPVANILSRLARCPECDRPMVMQRTNVPNQRYLICMAWRESRTCSSEWVRYPGIEDVFTGDVRFVIEGCPKPQLHPEARRLMLRTISGRLRTLRARQARETADRGTLCTLSRAGRTWAKDTAHEIDCILAERYRLRADRNYWQDATLNIKLEELRTAAVAQPRDLVRLNAALRALLVKVVVDWENERLILYWRHAGQSYVYIWIRRLRGKTRNLTPPDRKEQTNLSATPAALVSMASDR